MRVSSSVRSYPLDLLKRLSSPKPLRSGRPGLVTALALLMLATGCATTDEPRRPVPVDPAPVTLAVYGPGPVITAYKEIAARFTLAHPATKVVVKSYATHDEALAALARASADGDPPDLFLVDHDDLTGLAAQRAIRRVDDLLAARKVDFGDGYSRSSLEAFSSNAALRCMPSDISPLVVYFNPKLIELDLVAELGSNRVDQGTGWSLEEFARAALQARGPGVRGLYVEPDLEQVAPFIWSGGGEVVDDPQDPTTLTLSQGGSASALEQLLLLVRDPALTFGEAALRRQSALDRFKAGKLGMILGSRELTPVLRAQQNLTFDVMPLPKLGRGATTATMSGLCISSKSQQTSKTADFLAAIISKAGARVLAATGYVMPANLDVVNSDDFLQTGQRPLNAQVFAREVRNTRLLPSTARWPAVRADAARELTRLFYEPVILPLQDRLLAIDQGSVPIFGVRQSGGDPGESPSATARSGPTGATN